MYLFLLGLAYAEQGCRFPGAPAHSSVIFSDETLGPGTVATYTCERGFELLGPARRVCEPDGRWLPDGIPFCGKYADYKSPISKSHIFKNIFFSSSIDISVYEIFY